MQLEITPTVKNDVLSRGEELICKLLPGDIKLSDPTITSLARYSAALLDINEKINLTGAKTLEGLIIKHVLDVVCAVQAPFPFSKKLVDVGSGGGIPGIILAILWENAQVHLVERRQKKAGCLQALVDCLGLHDRVPVHAEDLHQVRPSFLNEDLWFRGFSPGAELAEFINTLYPRGRQGHLIFMKGPRWEEEKSQIVASKKVEPRWKEAIVKKSKEYKYVLPENAGERVLVHV